MVVKIGMYLCTVLTAVSIDSKGNNFGKDVGNKKC